MANRVTKVGTCNYTWDNNGNLLNDGSATYLYDRANRMISTTVGGVTTQFNYNGDGARLKQIIGSTVTTYTQDLAAPLPVVLEAKTGVTTTKYLYSLGTRPLAQYGGAWEYLLPDALGSVRQIVDTNGNVTLAESYEPYGSVLNSSGTASSIFAYAGEQLDSYIKLLFLRARYYSPETARFLSKDMWQGDYTRPQSLNAWVYVEGNPINFTDSSGLIKQGAEAVEADKERGDLSRGFGVEIARDYGESCMVSLYNCVWHEGFWRSVDEIKQVSQAATLIVHAMDPSGNTAKFKQAMQPPVRIRRTPTNPWGAPYTFDSFSAIVEGTDIWLPDSTFSSPDYAQYSIIHEFGHVWDFREDRRLSRGMGLALGTEVCLTWYSDWVGEVCDCQFDPTREKEPPPGTIVNPYAHTSPEEDWAEAFMAYIYPSSPPHKF